MLITCIRQLPSTSISIVVFFLFLKVQNFCFIMYVKCHGYELMHNTNFILGNEKRTSVKPNSKINCDNELTTFLALFYYFRGDGKLETTEEPPEEKCRKMKTLHFVTGRRRIWRPGIPGGGRPSCRLRHTQLHTRVCIRVATSIRRHTKCIDKLASARILMPRMYRQIHMHTNRPAITGIHNNYRYSFITHT